ncbi:hypothetical protein CVY60_20285 [Cronobacter sakazakii]|nr:hypothetical protein [Cronobacter sakazakii]PUX25909.1 hypothetical protein BS413_00955 [Cronobacter malonaticus]MCI0221530.1 hypothetical protein [Cronobacter sakazakii]PPX86070.1 hypothetical protein C3D77_21645 [Cronobacter sakazakii]PPY29792.1 hypothetical protein C3D75_21135 [Cronobacter sakazakii]
MTKTALHRTRLRVLDHKIFSVLSFYSRYRQPAPLPGWRARKQTEKVERNFTVFHFRFFTKLCGRELTR